MIKNGEIIMCQDDVAQLCSQAKVAKQLAGQSLIAVAGGEAVLGTGQEEGGDTIRVAVETEAPGRDRQE